MDATLKLTTHSQGSNVTSIWSQTKMRPFSVVKAKARVDLLAESFGPFGAKELKQTCSNSQYRSPPLLAFLDSASKSLDPGAEAPTEAMLSFIPIDRKSLHYITLFFRISSL